MSVSAIPMPRWSSAAPPTVSSGSTAITGWPGPGRGRWDTNHPIVPGQGERDDEGGGDGGEPARAAR
jgi:hypothetical protein